MKLVPSAALRLVLVVLVGWGCSGGDGEEMIDAAHDAVGDTTPGSAITISAVTPATASFRGGAALTLSGTALDGVTEVSVGGTFAAITARGPTSLTITAPPAIHGGAALVIAASPTSAAQWTGFAYVGIAPPALRFVELPGDVPPATGDRFVALARDGAPPRVAVLGVDALGVFDVTADGLVPAFALETAPSGLGAFCASDFDRDGDDDLYLAAKLGAGVWGHEAAGLAVPASGAAVVASLAVCADFTGDEHPDVLLVLSPADGLPSLRLLVNDGDGELAAAASGLTLNAEATSVATADVDGDGHRDVLLARASLPPRLLLGDGAGGFADAPAGSLPAGGDGALVAFGDLDGDGAPDGVLVTAAGVLRWKNNGGRLADHSGLAQGLTGATAVALEDLDKDGALDVLISATSGVRVLRNDGQGRLFDYSDTLLPWPGRADVTRAIALDADGDGDLDLVAARPGDVGPALLRSWDPVPYRDGDLDGIPDEFDGCPDHANTDQKNRDRWHFNCEAPAECAAATGCSLRVDQGRDRAYLECPAPIERTAAAAQCEALGASLLVIDDADELGFLISSLAPGRYWMGVSDQVEEGVFRTDAGDAAPFSQWGPDQPDDAGGNEDCVELIATDPQNPYFNDLPCAGYTQGYVCEGGVEVPVPDPQDACDVCPDVLDPTQADTDGDGVGDACDLCPQVWDPEQFDTNQDGLGDACTSEPGQ